MSLSIRNQLAGTVTSVTRGEVMAAVKVRLDGGQDVTAAITLEAVKELDLAEGSCWRRRVRCVRRRRPCGGRRTVGHRGTRRSVPMRTARLSFGA